MLKKIREDNQSYRMMIIFILCLGSTCTSGVPYLIRSYYSIYKNSVGLTNAQMGLLITMFGIGGMILYFPGGFLADKFSPKKLIVLSYISSAVLSLIMFTRPSYPIMLAIYLGYAVTAVMIEWSSETKIVRVMGTDEEQGKIYGAREALAGLGGMSLGLIVLFIGAKIGDESTTLNILIMSYAMVGIICAILLALMLDNRSENAPSDQVDFSVIGKVMKNKKVWLVAFIVFVAYTIYSSLTYFSPYIEEVYGMSSNNGAVFGVIRQYGVRIFMCSLLGLLADKMGSPIKLLRYCFAIVCLHMIAYIFIPGSKAFYILSLVLMIVVTCLAAGMRALYYSQMGECGFPVKYTGTIIGLIALFGYTPDAFFYTMVGNWIDKYGILGYKYLFTYCAVLTFLGILATIVLVNTIKKENASK